MAEIPRTSNLSTNAAQGLLGFADRLRSVKEVANQAAEQENIRIGQEKARQVQLVKDEETGITKSPEKRQIRLLGGVQDRAFNSTLQAGYVAGVQNDVRKKVAELTLNHAEDPEGFDAELKSFQGALNQTLDASIRQDVLAGLEQQVLRPRLQIEAKYRQIKAEEAKLEFETFIDQETEDVRKIALAGDRKQIGAAQAGLKQQIEAAAREGVISKFEASNRIRALEEQVVTDTLTGEVQRLFEGGGLRAASKALVHLKTNVSKFLPVDKHQSFVQETFRFVKQLNDLQEIEDDAVAAESAAAQRANFVSLVKSQRDGAVSHTDLLGAFERGTIDLDQYERLRARQESQGGGVTDVTIAGELERRIAQGEDVGNEILEAGSNQLTDKDKQDLLKKNEDFKADAAKGPQSILKSDEFRALLKETVAAIKIKPGGIGAKFKADTRLADAATFERKLKEIAVAGGDWRGYGQSVAKLERDELELKRVRRSEKAFTKYQDEVGSINKLIKAGDPGAAKEELVELLKKSVEAGDPIDRRTYEEASSIIESHIQHDRLDAQVKEYERAIK